MNITKMKEMMLLLCVIVSFNGCMTVSPKVVIYPDPGMPLEDDYKMKFVDLTGDPNINLREIKMQKKYDRIGFVSFSAFETPENTKILEDTCRKHGADGYIIFRWATDRLDSEYMVYMIKYIK